VWEIQKQYPEDELMVGYMIEVSKKIKSSASYRYYELPKCGEMVGLLQLRH